MRQSIWSLPVVFPYLLNDSSFLASCSSSSMKGKFLCTHCLLTRTENTIQNTALILNKVGILVPKCTKISWMLIDIYLVIVCLLWRLVFLMLLGNEWIALKKSLKSSQLFFNIFWCLYYIAPKINGHFWREKSKEIILLFFSYLSS